ncbi:chromosome segregation protein SMC [soil metagenome]
MHLQSLQLHGFKSFADKTTFEFHPGVTSIVGPNGCGKSNVVDAIRWVLGETSAKALRGGEMADVIFNGTDKRQPLGLAEVTLTLADCEERLGTDFNEIAITRRVFRDGKSEYRINNQLCRLRDINELLMDTGMGQSAYSIMEQGKIDMLLSSKPEDRRAVFEEAAGITKFKSQKKEALRKLEYTEANLLRISDIVAEVKRQMGSLQRQAAKARRYQALLQDVRILDTHYSHRRLVQLQSESAEYLASVESLMKQATDLQHRIGDGEQEISDARTVFQQLEERVANARQHGNELKNRAQSARNRIGFNAERTRELDSLIAQNAADIDATRSKFSEQQTQIATAEESLSEVVTSIHRQQAQLDEHAAKTAGIRQQREQLTAALAQLRRLATEAENTIVNTKAQLASSLTRVESDAQRKDQLSNELGKLESERNAKLAEQSDLSSELAEVREFLEEHTEVVKTAERDAQVADNNLADLEQRLTKTHKEFTEKSSRLDVLQQLVASGEGLEKGTQAVLKGLDQPDFYKAGTRGVLTSFLEVEPEFIPAIEGALGPVLQTVLVADTNLAESIIDTLVRKKLGQVNLLAEDLCPAGTDSQMMALPDGARAWALDKISVQKQVKPLVQRLLENVVIVGNLSDALRLRSQYGDLIYATMNGEVVTPDGLIKGGSTGKAGAGSLLQRQSEIRDLDAAAKALAKSRAALESEVDAGRARIAELKSHLAEARARLQENQVQESKLAGQLSLVEREIGQMGSKLEGVQWEQGELFKRVETAENQIAELKAAQASARVDLEKRTTEIRDQESRLGEIAREESESAELLAELRTNVAVERRAEEALRQQKEPMRDRLRELEELIARREAEIASYREKMENAGGESDGLQDEIATAEADLAIVQTKLAEMESERATQDESLRATEKGLLAWRRDHSAITEQRGNAEIKITQLDLRIESLANAILERYDVTLHTFEPDTHALLTSIDTQKQTKSRNEKRAATLAAQGDENPEGTPDPNEPESAADDDRTGAEAGTGAEAEAEADVETGVEVESGNETIDLADEPDWEFVESVVGDLKRKLDSMGPVNLDAIGEFEELEERHTFLETQHDDLVNSKEELLRVIQKINTTTKEMFAETFAMVQKNFRGTFRELFGEGASSNLLLVDEDDPLESGIEIIAKPPGKKLQSITLLSGGERSMTAVALLFSIYMVKPSPFCVLDELDAPLDESNIGRFLKMLDRFIDQSQFVIVTHNKRTMSRADIMYGVTMQEYGVSKPVGMKLTRNEDGGPSSPAVRSSLPKSANEDAPALAG